METDPCRVGSSGRLLDYHKAAGRHQEKKDDVKGEGGSVHRARALCWILGLIGVVALLIAFRESEAWREIAPLALFLGVALIALVAELVALGVPAPARRLPSTPRDASPADGSVGIAPISGSCGDPNPGDPRFRRFTALGPIAGSPSGTGTVTGARRRPGPTTRELPPLLGRVVMISVFLGRDGRGWSDREIARAHDALFRAGLWIEREARRWDARVNLDLAGTYFVADEHEPEEVEVGFVVQGESVQPLDADATVKALTSASRAARQLGFRDAAALVAEINGRIEADTLVWILHPRRAGHSFAVALDDTELSGVSLVVCYARETSFPEPLPGAPFTDPITIVHELLHLFGASDKYGVPLHTFPARSVSHREIMRLDLESLSRSRIDPLTASEIGWKGG
jgi:hypothetical protein